MSQCHAASDSSDSKARRKLQDQRRMRFRRAIETYAEHRRLQDELGEFPDLAMISPLLDEHYRQSAAPAR